MEGDTKGKVKLVGFEVASEKDTWGTEVNTLGDSNTAGLIVSTGTTTPVELERSETFAREVGEGLNTGKALSEKS